MSQVSYSQYSATQQREFISELRKCVAPEPSAYRFVRILAAQEEAEHATLLKHRGPKLQVEGLESKIRASTPFAQVAGLVGMGPEARIRYASSKKKRGKTLRRVMSASGPSILFFGGKEELLPFSSGFDHKGFEWVYQVAMASSLLGVSFISGGGGSNMLLPHWVLNRLDSRLKKEFPGLQRAWYSECVASLIHIPEEPLHPYLTEGRICGPYGYTNTRTSTLMSVARNLFGVVGLQGGISTTGEVYDVLVDAKHRGKLKTHFQEDWSPDVALVDYEIDYYPHGLGGEKRRSFFWEPFFNENERMCHGLDCRIERKVQENRGLRNWLNRLNDVDDAKAKGRSFFEKVSSTSGNVFPQTLLEIFSRLNGVSLWDVVDRYFPSSNEFLSEELPKLTESCQGRFT